MWELRILKPSDEESVKKYKNCIVLLMGFAGTGKLTVARELARQPYFRLVDNHTWNNPVFNLITQDGFTPLTEAVWQKSGKICDVIFETIYELSPAHFSFAFTQEMIEGDEYPNFFYNRLSQLSQERKSIFLPVRLLCDESELIKRVQIIERQSLYKTIDPERASFLSCQREVFYSHHPNELAVDITIKKPAEAVKIILNKLDALSE